MKTIIQTSILLATVSALTACGGSGSPSVLNDPDSTVPTIESVTAAQAAAAEAAAAACDTAYHNAIRGSYNGQVEFNSPDYVETPKQCIWEVSLSVATDADIIGICSTTFSFQSDLTSGDASCTDLDTTGDINGVFGLDEEQPQFPLEIDLVSPTAMSAFDIYPTGDDSNNGRWSYIFDGQGNATFDEVSELVGYTGTLVLFSDQPFQVDGFTAIVGVQNETD